MDKITVKQAAEKWGVSTRWVQELCKKGKIVGAERWERTWMIPVNAKYVTEKGIELEDDPHTPMPKKSPFLDMTDLYTTPGTAEECIKSLSDQPEAAALLTAEFAYSRGQIDKVYEYARYFLKAHSGFYAVVASGMLLSLCAMYRGDTELWNEAKKHLYEAPCKNEKDREVLLMWLAATDSSIYDTTGFPKWFSRGDFSRLPTDAHPAARYFYVKRIYIIAHSLATGQLHYEDVSGLTLMKTLPYIIEPMISQAMVDRAVILEIYLRLIVAIAYHNISNEELAIEHLDKAIALALPDKLYGPLVEYRHPLDYLMDQRLAAADTEALKNVRELHKQLAAGWAKLHNTLLNRNVSNDLSTREREVAKLAAFGLSNQEISERLHISLSSVKSAIRLAMDKTGAEKRNELGAYI